MAHTDIVIIHLSNFHHIRALNLAAEIWTSLKAGNNENDLLTLSPQIWARQCAKPWSFSTYSLDQTVL